LVMEDDLEWVISPEHVGGHVSGAFLWKNV
jgi:hypothetical protein